MKKIVITLAVAAATLFAFSSCEKENLTNTSNNGVRVITATFENDGTKTTLNADGKTPEWAVGDVLRILNATTYQDVTLAAENITDNKITFTTTLTGTLYAVYPASATAMTSCSDGNVSFTVPAIQDGSFASANICVAKSSTTDETNKDNLVFCNATSVLKITTAADVVGVDVTTANSIAGAVTASFSGSELSLTTTSLDKKYISAVGTSAPSGNVFYLAAAPVTTGSATVNCYKTDKKGTAAKDSKALQRNAIYSMDLTSVTINISSNLTGQRGILNGHEYVIIKAKYDGSHDSYRKWATMNIGATTVTGETSYGDYFMWGAVEKAYTSLSGTTFTFGSKPSSYINSTWNAAKCFAWENCNFTNGVYNSGKKNVFTKYTTDNAYAKSGTADGKDVLEPADDVAAHMWGSTWRMPTGGSSGEFIALFNVTYWAWDGTDCGYYVFQPGQGTQGSAGSHKEINGTTDDKSKALLFFPFAGYVSDTSLKMAGSEGCFWSSTLRSSNPAQAFGPYFATTSFNLSNNYNYRYCGRPVRPVSD